jgi:hypothetical protein
MVFCSFPARSVGFRKSEWPGAPRLPVVVGWAVVLALAPLLQPWARAVCEEKPTVWMDERTAASHLLSKRDLEVPAAFPLARVNEVKLLVTVDRDGAICDVRAMAGPKELRPAAVQIVWNHWRYRRFLVDWKPTVVQFPVTVRTAPVRSGTPPVTIAEESNRNPLSTRA